MEELIKEIVKMDPENLGVILHGYVDQYKPLVYVIGRELLGIYKDYVDNNGLAELEAKSAKKKYNAYVNVGFTEEQAMTLLVNSNIAFSKAVQSANTSIKNNK